ncbi:hypothetical protein PAHAL_2G018200 [Panicum hallii]|uniref:F-box domain-containing protein n=1 Tax=Panicum hallii TaxID=206008 RepID=A0A2T8KMJ4_9POAL|nr:hypothetical protein PAHAL_2G018200 [Panicum hallii]
MAPPPPELMPELVGEILLRLPPEEPANLLRAALVCKPWLRTLCDPAFRRRYGAFHRTPPLLGLLHRLMAIPGDPTLTAAARAPSTAATAASSSTWRTGAGISSSGTRHGRPAAPAGARHPVVHPLRRGVLRGGRLRLPRLPRRPLPTGLHRH